MKVICIFCDMLRNDKMNLLNKKQPETKLDFFLKELGGTIFKNAFSPTPDTGRSLASFFTGKFSKNNGCYFQYQYPRYYLNNIYNLENLLEEKKIKSKFIIREENYILGNFPKNLKNIITINNKNSFKDEVIKSLEELKNEKDYFLFLNIDDYHLAIDTYGSINKGYTIGKDKIYKILQYIFKSIDKNILDYIFIFSDHGHKDNINKHNLIKNDLKLLFPDRSKIFLLVRKKNEEKLTVNYNIKSIVDFMPTFVEIFDIKSKNNFDGESIFKDKKDRMIALEGNESFFNSYSKLSIWGVAHKDFIFITNKSKKILINNELECINNNVDKKSLLNILKNETCNYCIEKKYPLNKDEIEKLNKLIKERNSYILYSYKYSDDSLISYKKFFKVNIKKLLLQLKGYKK